MSYIPATRNKISTLNSVTLTSLSAGQVWEGVSEDVSKYGRAGISIWTPFAEPTDGILTIEVSRDGVNWGGPDRDFENTAIAVPHMWNIVEKYFRIKYTNLLKPADSLVIQTQLSVNADIQLGHQLDTTLIDETEASVTRALLVGRDKNGVYKNVPVNLEGEIKTAQEDDVYTEVLESINNQLKIISMKLNPLSTDNETLTEDDLDIFSG